MNEFNYIDPLFKKELESVPFRVSREIDLRFGIVTRIHSILQRKGWTQADFAKAANKKESEISRWLSGSHNFTIHTIALIEEVLGEDILSVKQYRSSKYLYTSNENKVKYLNDSGKVKYIKK